MKIFLGVLFFGVLSFSPVLLSPDASASVKSSRSVPIPEMLNGNWTTGFQFLPMPQFGTGAFVEVGFNIDPSGFQTRVRSFTDLLSGAFYRAQNAIQDFEILSLTEVTPEGVGRDKRVPEKLYWMAVRAKGVRETLFEESNVKKANREEKCGLKNWVVGVPQQLLGTRCVIGNPEVVTGKIPLAWDRGVLISPLEDVPAGEGENPEDPDDPKDPSDPYEKIDGIRIDLREASNITLDMLNWDAPLRKLP